MRVVGSLTTIPSRIGNIKHTLNSINNQSHQLDAVYLNIPFFCQREDAEYKIPDNLSDYCHIIRGKDHGPITKIIGALISEQDPETIIITFDDDHIYPESIVEKLLAKHRTAPECAIGSAGIKIGTFPFYLSITHNQYEYNKRWFNFNASSGGEKVDIILGSPGVLYVRKFFPSIDKLTQYSSNDPVLYMHDDVVISAVLSERNIDRRVYKMLRIDDYGNDANAINKNIRTYMFSLINAIYNMRKDGMFKNRVQYKRSKTLTYPILLTLGTIIIFSILFSIRESN